MAGTYFGGRIQFCFLRQHYFLENRTDGWVANSRKEDGCGTLYDRTGVQAMYASMREYRYEKEMTHNAE